MQLRWYQEQAVKSLFNYFYKSDGNPIIVLPTGSGKSLVIAEIIKRMNENWPSERIMMCTHQKELIKQNYDELLRYYPEADAGIYSAGLNKKQTDHKVIFCGVQSAYKKAMHLGEFALMLVDECHLINSNDTGIYRKFIADLQKINPAMKVVGLSATPYRTKTGIITEGDDAIFTDICFEVGVAQLIQEGFLCPIISKNSVNRPDTSKLHIRAGEFIDKEMQDIFDVDAVVTGAVNEIAALAHDRKKIMVFCAGIEHAEHVTKELNAIGIKAECTHSKKSKTENDQIIDNFRHGRIRAIVNVDCLTTGFNVKDVDCIAMLRSTMSPGLYYQVCVDEQTEILTDRGFLKHNELNKNDLCYALNLENNSIEKTKIQQIIKNYFPKNEKMYSYESDFVDFRISRSHDLVVKSRKSKKWIKEKIDDVVFRKELFHIPSCGIENVEPCNLKDEEIEFLGWFLTDGCLNKKTNAIAISQSMENKKYVEEIELCLNKIGLKYGKHIIKRKDKYSKYKDSIIFTISKGKPRGRDNHKKGWEYLSDFIDKSINKNYDKFDKRQINILIKSMNKANGSKPKNISWDQKTKTICFGINKKGAENLQSILIRRGFRTRIYSLVPPPNEWNKNPKEQTFLKIKDVLTSSIAGCNCKDGKISNKKKYKRSRIKEEILKKDELIWCIKNEFGTIITRRNGKVMIMGNCGRGLRIHPNKENCLFLDFGGNILRHGPIDQIHIKNKNGKRELGVAPMKECPNCKNAIYAVQMVCPECGYEYPDKGPNHEATASNLKAVSTWEAPKYYDVSKVSYNIHKKLGSTDSLKVTYHIDMLNDYSEWVCLGHSGYAGIKAKEWWIDRIDRAEGAIVPDEVGLALLQTDELRQPKRILVDINGKYPAIKGYEF